MSAITKRMLALALTLVLSSLFFLGLYTFDNKYTHGGVQPANGLIDLTAQELAQVPVHYLIKDWIFYPGVLLGPEEFASGSPDRYSVYTDIGERVRLDDLGAKDSPHGSGTYVLHLRLPAGRAVYALELPEIFSAYRLFVNDFLYAQMGNPDPDHYEARTQRRQISFEADGAATIVLAVSDFSHYYSGLVYPPAFGSPERLNTLRGALLGICLFIDTLSLVAAALALYLGLRMKEKNALLFAPTCLVMCTFTSYALIHIVSLPVFPWYALELTSGYLFALLVVVLHNRICDAGYLTRRISTGIAAAVCLLSLVYGLSAAFLTVPVIEAFSTMVAGFKLLSAGYLIVTAALSLRRQVGRAAPLFYASAIYAAALVWDRLLPNHEPMLSGWFAEWGSLALLLAIGYTLWRDLVTAYSYSLAFAEEHRQVTRQLGMQVEYAKLLAARGAENRKLIHDFRQHLRTMNGLAARFNTAETATLVEQELAEYLERLAQSMSAGRRPGGTNRCFSTNPAVDALLQYYNALADEKGYVAELQLDLPEHLPLGDVELCTVLGNLLENAVEACQRMAVGERTIYIRTSCTERRCIIQINNSYDGKLLRQGERFLSRKTAEQRFGVGLESVREIVERNGGMLMLDVSQELFSVGVALPIRA